MNKEVIFVLFFVAACPLVFAQEQVSVQVYKELYVPGESVQAEIRVNGSVSEIDEHHIELHNEQGQKIAIAPFLDVIENGHLFLVFDLPLGAEEGVYALKVVDIPFQVNNVLQLVTAEKPLSVAPATPVISLFPGFVKVDRERVSVNVRLTNKGGSAQVQVAAPEFVAHVYQTPQVLNQGATRLFKFAIDASAVAESTKEFITFSYANKEYKLPLFIFKEETGESIWEDFFFVTTTSLINKTIGEDEMVERVLRVKNNGSAQIELSLHATPEVSEVVEVSPSNIILAPGEEKEVLVSLNKEKDAIQGIYRGSIVAATTKKEVVFGVVVEVRGSEVGIITKQDIFDDLPLEVPDKKEQKGIQVIDFNFTSTQEAEPSDNKRKGGFLVLSLVIVLLLLFVFLIKKKNVKRTTFQQYISGMKKR